LSTAARMCDMLGGSSTRRDARSSLNHSATLCCCCVQVLLLLCACVCVSYAAAGDVEGEASQYARWRLPRTRTETPAHSINTRSPLVLHLVEERRLAALHAREGALEKLCVFAS
jgi:hypothetical protein